MTTNKLRIGVLMGGKSIEREVSFNSGRTICDHLDTERYAIIPIFQTETGTLYLLPQHFLHRGKIADFFARLEHEAQRVSWDELKTTVDFIYLAVHGRYAEDGTVQGMLEIIGIPYLGAKVLGSALGMNKTVQKDFLAGHGIDVPAGIALTASELAGATEQSLVDQLEQLHVSFPVIVKPIHEGSSYGIAVVTQPQDLLAALHAASSVDPRRTQDVLIEEKLEGMEFVCVTLEKVRRHNNINQRTQFSLPLTEVVIEQNSQIFDYEQKYMPGRALKITPARCSSQDTARIMDVCKKVSELLEFCNISRIDGFLTTDGRVVIIDPNSLTGMSPSTFLFNQAAEYGMSHTELINFLIENELKSYGLIDDETFMPCQRDNVMTTQQKIRVAVLLGGDSNERETSLETGRNVCYKLSPQKYDVIPLFVNDNMELFKLDQKLLIKNSTHAINNLVTPELNVQWSALPNICDFVFIGLHGGKGENGAVQGALEMLDLPYNGPGVLASALCMDKYKTNNFLRTKGFDVPKSLLLEKQQWLACLPESKEEFLQTLLASHSLTLPLVVKPHDDGCSVMVEKATRLAELSAGLDGFFASSKNFALLEEMIIGVELTVGVLGNDNPIALPPSMAVAQNGILTMQEKFLPGAGENQTPAPLPQPVLGLVQKTVAKVFKTIDGQGYSRIDCFYQDASQSPTGIERVIILEINTIPALTPATCFFHQAAELGIKPMDVIDRIVQLGLERHQQQHLSSTATGQQTLFAATHDEPEQVKPKVAREKPSVQAESRDTELQMMKLF